MSSIADIRCEMIYRAIELAANSHMAKTAEEIVKDATVLENYVLNSSKTEKNSGYQTTGNVTELEPEFYPEDSTPAYAEEYPNRNRGYEGGN